MDTIEQKLKDFREALLDKDYPFGIDEILGQIAEMEKENVI